MEDGNLNPNTTGQTAPGYKLNKVQALAIASFIGAPVASGILMRMNFINLGNKKAGDISLVVSIIVTILLFVGIMLLPEHVIDSIPRMAIPIVYTALIALLGEKFFGKKINAHAATGGAFYSYWRSAWVGLVCLVAIFILLIATLMLIPF